MASIIGYTKAKIDTMLALLAPLISPAFTGTPTAPTAAPGDNSTKLATTAFVAASQAAQLISPVFTGTPTLPTGTIGVTQAPGDSSTKIATTAFVATSFAPLASPTFTGIPILPSGTIGTTQAPGDSSTKLATTAFVATSFAPLASPTFTGSPVLPTGTTGTTQAAGDSSTKLATTAFVQTGKTKTVNAQAGTTYTLVLSDTEKLIEATNAGAQTITVPPNSSVAFPIGTILQMTQMGAGKASFAAGAGVTINSPGALLGCRVQYSTITLRKRATDIWVLSDDVG